jgi:uncharacterized membrane protein YecN with MAPEG domain
MGIVALTITCVLYAFTAIEYYRKKDIGMALAFFAYALANVGFIINLWNKPH